MTMPTSSPSRRKMTSVGMTRIIFRLTTKQRHSSRDVSVGRIAWSPRSTSDCDRGHSNGPLPDENTRLQADLTLHDNDEPDATCERNTLKTQRIIGKTEEYVRYQTL